MAKRLLPVGREPLVAKRQNAGGQIGRMGVWKDEETAVVGHQVEAIKLMAEVPSDPALPCCALPGGCGKSEKGHPRIFPRCDIPKGFADLGQRTQVMMLLHQFLESLFFAGKNSSENDFRQVQKMPPDEWVERQHNLSIHHPERIVHFFRYLVAIIIVSGQDRITLVSFQVRVDNHL